MKEGSLQSCCVTGYLSSLNDCENLLIFSSSCFVRDIHARRNLCAICVSSFPFSLLLQSFTFVHGIVEDVFSEILKFFHQHISYVFLDSVDKIG